MASRRKLVDPSASRHDPAVLEEYVASLGGELFGLRRDRARILDELRSGLEEATDERTSRGMPAPAAAEAAIDDLGSPATVAAAFSGELAIRLARRMLWVLLLTGPMVGIWWLLLLAPAPWVPQFGALLTAIPILPLIAAAIATAIVAIATTGSLIRWLPEAAPQRALSAATAVALVCIVGDTTMLSILAFRSATGLTELVQALAIAAIAASAIRIVGSAWVIRQCLRARAAVAAAQSPRPQSDRSTAPEGSRPHRRPIAPR